MLGTMNSHGFSREDHDAEETVYANDSATNASGTIYANEDNASDTHNAQIQYNQVEMQVYDTLVSTDGGDEHKEVYNTLGGDNLMSTESKYAMVSDDDEDTGRKSVNYADMTLDDGEGSVGPMWKARNNLVSEISLQSAWSQSSLDSGIDSLHGSGSEVDYSEVQAVNLRRLSANSSSVRNSYPQDQYGEHPSKPIAGQGSAGYNEGEFSTQDALRVPYFVGMNDSDNEPYEELMISEQSKVPEPRKCTCLVLLVVVPLLLLLAGAGVAVAIVMTGEDGPTTSSAALTGGKNVIRLFLMDIGCHLIVVHMPKIAHFGFDLFCWCVSLFFFSGSFDKWLRISFRMYYRC